MINNVSNWNVLSSDGQCCWSVSRALMWFQEALQTNQSHSPSCPNVDKLRIHLSDVYHQLITPFNLLKMIISTLIARASPLICEGRQTWQVSIGGWGERGAMIMIWSWNLTPCLPVASDQPPYSPSRWWWLCLAGVVVVIIKGNEDGKIMRVTGTRLIARQSEGQTACWVRVFSTPRGLMNCLSVGAHAPLHSWDTCRRY